MQTGDGVEVPIVAEYRKTMLQRAGCNPHVIGRNGTAAASEFPIHHSILRRRLSVDYQLVHPLRRQELLQFLAISRLTRAYGKTAEQLTEHNTIDPNPWGVREHVHSIGQTSFEGHIGVGIEEDVSYCHNAGSTCSKSATACKKAAASAALQVPASASRS